MAHAAHRAITARVEHDRGVFMISVAAELAEMHPQTLRMYEARGLIEPKRSPKGTRLYSQADVERLRRIQEMTTELGHEPRRRRARVRARGAARLAWSARSTRSSAAPRQLQEEIARLEEVRRDGASAEIVRYEAPGHRPRSRSGTSAGRADSSG